MANLDIETSTDTPSETELKELRRKAGIEGDE